MYWLFFFFLSWAAANGFAEVQEDDIGVLLPGNVRGEFIVTSPLRPLADSGCKEKKSCCSHPCKEECEEECCYYDPRYQCWHYWPHFPPWRWWYLTHHTRHYIKHLQRASRH